jgi:hypothetical protein
VTFSRSYRGFFETYYRGSPIDHTHIQRASTGMHEARRAFRAATLAGDMGAAIAAELVSRPRSF